MDYEEGMTTDIRFYHLTNISLERALPQLLEKAYAGGFRTLVKVADAESAASLDALLWSYDPASFLPHAKAEDKDAASNPIVLHTEFSRVNEADLLAVTDGTLPDSVEDFRRVLDIFDDNGKDAARERWKFYKDAGHALQYWQQTTSGGWEQKA